MSGLNRESLKFLASYELSYRQATIAANSIRKIVEETVGRTGAFVQIVSARAKTPTSLRAKLRRKKYKRPSRSVTDLIGVRIITYYRDAVDPIVERLKQELEIDLHNSVDKRLQLGLRDFGYRSVHLIARVRSTNLQSEDHKMLRGKWFEIQVRSILEHAWAEIEHEVVYKSGIDFPDETKRRFSAIAGNLELLDNEFEMLRATRVALIDAYCELYRSQKDLRRKFDVARLIAFLEVCRPAGYGWRKAESDGQPFRAGIDAVCVDALCAVGLGCPVSLQAFLRRPAVRSAVQRFATSKGIAASRLSHLAVVLIAISKKDGSVVRRHFPEVFFDFGNNSLIN